MGVTTTVKFPSVEWFQALADLMTEDIEKFRKLGETDCTMAVNVIDGREDGSAWNVVIEFEEFSINSIREVTEEELNSIDFVITTDMDSWLEMIENIKAGGGRPDLEHSLNALTIAGVPMRCWSTDPLGRDAFFRYNQSLQQYINNCARL